MSPHVCLPLLSLVQKHGTRRTTTCDGRQFTAQGLHDRVAYLSWGCSNILNIIPGDRIALLGLNSDAFFESLLAVIDAGAVACPMNWRWSATEVAAAIELTQPSYLFADDSCMQLALAAQCKSAFKATILQMGPASAVQQQAEAAAGTVHQAPQLVIDKRSSCNVSSLQELLAAAVAAHQASTAAAAVVAQGDPSKTATVKGASAASFVLAGQRQEQQQHPQLQLLLPGGAQQTTTSSCSSSSSSSDVPPGTALICFTSGTTGASKGAMLSHSAIMHQSMAKLAVVQYSDADVYLHVAPLFHVGGLSSAFAVLAAGGQHVFMPRYSPSTALQLIAQHNVTAMIAVPAMMQDIVAAAAAAATHQQQQQQQAQLPNLRRVLVGAGGMSQQLQAAVAQLCPNAHLSTAYGMTECASSITFIALQEQQQRMAAAAATGGHAAAAAGVCVGWPGPGIAIRIDNTRFEAPEQPQHMFFTSSGSSSDEWRQQQQQQQGQTACYQVGEVCSTGPHVMQGYYKAADATTAVYTQDGWLRTGDLGYLDASGCLWLLGRSKDMIKTGGENVLAAEVERVILQHPGVAAAAVVGLQHSRFGEQVAAAVVLQQGWAWGDSDLSHPQQQQQQVLTIETLQQHCRNSGLSPYKVPRVVVHLQSLPLNSSGKVVKARVKEQLEQQQQQRLRAAHGGQAAHRSKL